MRATKGSRSKSFHSVCAIELATNVMLLQCDWLNLRVRFNLYPEGLLQFVHSRLSRDLKDVEDSTPRKL